jgi:hypothetical protein
MAMITFWLTVAGMICWGACFGWMYLISRKQNKLLARLTEQGQRIEKLSKIEHDLIKEVHPNVADIKDSVEEVMAAVRESAENSPSPPKAKKG